MVKKTDNFYEVEFTILGRVVIWLLTSIAIGLVLFLFYHNLLISLIGLIVSVLLLDYLKRIVLERRIHTFTEEFRELLYFTSSSLSAGTSIQNVFSEARDEFGYRYGDNSYLVDGLKEIDKELSLNVSIEDALQHFSDKYAVDDVRSFVDVFRTCNRTSGNTSEVVKLSSNMIAEKMETMREAENIIRSRRNESYITTFSPLVGILFMNLISSDYMNIMYTTLIGRGVMTGVLLITVGCFAYSRKITSIKV